MFTPDEGYFFGLGAFETIAIEKGKPIFLEQHYERLRRTIEYFSLEIPMDQIKQKVTRALQDASLAEGRKVLKITVSPRNILVTFRENTYTPSDYERGFTAAFSQVRRNETSPFTYHKTLNYGDCILEKRRAKEGGIDEPIFLNSAGMIAEGACTNVFFVKNSQIITPALSCGLLPGIMRDYVRSICPVQEQIISPQEAVQCEEMFLTNSLLGIMPVAALGSHQFPSREKGQELLDRYQELISSF